MLLEFGRKGTTFLSNTDVLDVVFCYFFKKYRSFSQCSFFLLKNISTFVWIMDWKLFLLDERI